MLTTSRIERIFAGERLLAIVISGEYDPESTEFVTAPDMNMQVGFIKYPRGGVIQPHVHRPVERRIVGTSELLVVREGEVEVSLYDGDRHCVATRALREGDMLLLLDGGHGFRVLRDSVLLEVKQGPYSGTADKEPFSP